MQIYVKDLQGNTLTFEIDGSSTLRDLKMKVQEKEKLRPDQQRFIYAGSQLFNEDGSIFDEIDEILRRCGRQPIKGDHSDITLHLVKRLRGGGNRIYHRPVFASLSDSESDEDDQFSGSDQIGRNSSSDQSPYRLLRNGSSESAAFEGASVCGPYQVKGVPDPIQPSVEDGDYEDDADLLGKKNELASNVFPKKRHRFQIFHFDAGLSIKFVMLTMATAVLFVPKAMREISRMLQGELVKHDEIGGISKMERGNHDGTKGIVNMAWDTVVEDGGSIALCAALLVFATAFLLLAFRRYRLAPLRQEKQKLYIEVLRNGKRVKVSVSEIIAGDVVLSEQPTRLDDTSSTRSTITMMPSTVSQVFKCKMCNRQFPSLVSLRGHTAAIHKKTKLNESSTELQIDQFIGTAQTKRKMHER